MNVVLNEYHAEGGVASGRWARAFTDMVLHRLRMRLESQYEGQPDEADFDDACDEEFGAAAHELEDAQQLEWLTFASSYTVWDFRRDFGGDYPPAPFTLAGEQVQYLVQSSAQYDDLWNHYFDPENAVSAHSQD